MRHVIDGSEGGREGLLALAQRGLELRAGARPRRFEGGRLAALFFNPSLRTRSSLEFAAAALGIHPVVLEPGGGMWGLELREGAVMDGDKAEHIADAVGVLSGYADVLAVRAFAGLEDAELDRREPVLSAVIRHSRAPVLNLESARWHPLQGLADAATWLARLGPDLRGQALALTWAPHPRALPAAVPNQVLLTASLLGMSVTVAHPPGFDLDPEIAARAAGLAQEAGGSVTFSHDQRAAVAGARAVVVKSWSGFSGYGRRAEEAEARRDLARWRVDTDLLAAAPGAGLMHCLPVRRGVVATDGALDGPRSWVQETANLRLWTAMAVLERMMEGRWSG